MDDPTGRYHDVLVYTRGELTEGMLDMLDTLEDGRDDE